MAWPSATYEGAEAGTYRPVSGGFDISAVLYGRSSLEGNLWTEVVINVRNGKVSGVEWGSHSPALIPPGTTMKFLGAALAELTESYQRQQRDHSRQRSPNPPPSNHPGYDIIFYNKCPLPVEIAIRYQDVASNWRTEGWWKLSGNRSMTLADTNSKLLKTRSATLYYYAETTDESNLVWKGNQNFELAGRNLKMYRWDDKKGATDVSLTCDSVKSAKASTPTRHDLAFQNRCHRPATVAIQYLNSTGKWQVEGWWTIAPKERTYLLDGARQRIKTKTGKLYYYAETRDENPLFWRGELSTRVGDRVVKMREFDDRVGETTLALDCDDTVITITEPFILD